MIDMSYRDLAELFEERYKANVDDFRPICDLFLEDKRGVTIWTDNGDMIIFCPKEIN